MKRHASLIPLSHDHHQALLVALRLKKGGPASWRDSWPADLGTQREALLSFVERELVPHFRLEEELLFPACTNGPESLATAAAALATEHDLMRQLLAQIRTSSLTSLHDKLGEFGALLEAHVRKEERTFFPLLETAIETGTVAVDLDALATRYAAFHKPPGPQSPELL